MVFTTLFHLLSLTLSSPTHQSQPTSDSTTSSESNSKIRRKRNLPLFTQLFSSGSCLWNIRRCYLTRRKVATRAGRSFILPYLFSRVPAVEDPSLRSFNSSVEEE
ncbi:unnamed protein product [Cuscuta epithymum]|uniref:Secreted protein n=1 Tax=Cuscuta epithymum TaxID=186058 RepID=A0AAV0GHE0_9ASTE|nr:unnamed protein product [Cuscuta epithymum]